MSYEFFLSYGFFLLFFVVRMIEDNIFCNSLQSNVMDSYCSLDKNPVFSSNVN